VALERCDKRGLENVRFIRADAREFVEFFLPANSVQAFHLYFPDPWPKKRHHKRRLFDDAFLREVTRTLRVGGVLRLATDHDDYFETMVEVLDRAPGLAEVEIVWDGVRTNYEDKFLAKGKQINRRVMEKSLPL
jgi:tRNA (guanine-N7-)-methyltransferase